MKTIKVVITIVAMSVSLVSHAGLVQPAPVAVELESQFASGDMMSARWSKNDAVYIGCGIRSFDDGAGGSFDFGFCQAEDDEGDSAICSTQNSSLIESMHTINDDSYIQFSWNDAGECIALGFSTQSIYHNKDNPSFLNKND